jgi:hypothetical protein
MARIQPRRNLTYAKCGELLATLLKRRFRTPYSQGKLAPNTYLRYSLLHFRYSVRFYDTDILTISHSDLCQISVGSHPGPTTRARLNTVLPFGFSVSQVRGCLWLDVNEHDGCLLSAPLENGTVIDANARKILGTDVHLMDVDWNELIDHQLADDPKPKSLFLFPECEHDQED